jgi:hypothetical protein
MIKDEIFKMLKSEIKTELDRSAFKSKNPKTVAVRVWWDFTKSPKLSLNQKNMVARSLKSRLARNGVLVVNYKKQPTEVKNAREALMIMTRLVAHALKKDDQVFKQARTSSQQDTLIRKGWK